MQRSTEIEIKVGVFVALGCALIMFVILILGSGESLFQRTLNFHTKFPQVEGVVEGAMVKVSGVRVGQVKKIKFLDDAIDVTFSVRSKYKEAIHADSIVGINTQGVLGDRYIVVSAGSPGSPLALNGSELRSELPKDLKDYLNTADEVLDRLKNSLIHMEGVLSSFNKGGRSDIFFKNMTSFSNDINKITHPLPDKMKNFHSSLEHLNSVMRKIDNGHGTLGALVNDPTLYDDMKALLGGANRNKVLKYFIQKSVNDSREAASKK